MLRISRDENGKKYTMQKGRNGMDNEIVVMKVGSTIITVKNEDVVDGSVFDMLDNDLAIFKNMLDEEKEFKEKTHTTNILPLDSSTG